MGLLNPQTEAHEMVPARARAIRGFRSIWQEMRFCSFPVVENHIAWHTKMARVGPEDFGSARERKPQLSGASHLEH